MNLLPYYRSQFIANCIHHESDWSEELLTGEVSHWHRKRDRYDELFQMSIRDQQVWFEYSITIPKKYIRLEQLSGMSARCNEEFMLLTYAMECEQIGGSVLRFMFKARSEIAQKIDFTGANDHCRRQDKVV
ncbi:hypothetical protein PaecuDRAFT_4310 [Paenibacillus curdlanolyticus YK9]|uniref:Uncharacterized protein n=1 Tax=Paenibacillus curdlanolyticus YK9 TaxID=717606 RepID=E0IF69_9BACL|nr:hypothetical protein [Paenibacillus curdlanolyticus]EFM08845.1 hypothetical protein PaecuDRAFT_4310 [Paenibacillus curdlanolyticus YK9]